MIFSTLMLGALSLSVAQPETAEPAPQQTESREEAKDEAKEDAKEARKICRRVVDGMGSRRKVRLCMTSEEWRDFNRGQ